MKKKLVAVLLTTVMALSFSTGPITAKETNLTLEETAFLAKLDYVKLEENARYLTEEIGNRYTTSFREDITVEWLCKELKSYGYVPEVREFPVATPYISGYVQVDGVKYVYQGPSYHDTDSKFKFIGDLGGSAVKVPGWTPTTTNAAIPEGNYEDKVVFLCATAAITATHYDLAINALQEYNPAGIVFIHQPAREDGNTSYSRMAYSAYSGAADITIPVGTLLHYEAEDFIGAVPAYNDADAASFPVSLNLKLGTMAKNVIATLPSATGNKETVYITPHHDSQISGPGMNDNGSGTVMTLAQAKAFKDVEFDANIVFLFCGAEEVGLRGARQYVAAMTDEEKKNFKADYTMDMISTAQENCKFMFMNISDTRLQTMQSALGNNPDVALKDNPAAVAIAEEYEVYNSTMKAAQKLDFPMEMMFFCYDTTTDHYAFVEEGKKGLYPNMMNSIEYDWRTNRRGNGFEALYHKVGDTYALNFSAVRMKLVGDIVTLAIYDTAGGDPVHPTALKLLNTSTALGVGKTMTVAPQFTPADTTNQQIIWTSSNERVATVEDGVVKAVGAGSVTITATTVDGGITQKFALKIM